MKKLSALFCLMSSVLCPMLVSAQAPQLINYQGRLLNGTNLVNANVGLSLRLFNVPSGGTSIYEDSNTVTVADGLYSTFIGDDPTNGFISVLTNNALYVEVAVNGIALAPRERLASAAFSLVTRGLLSRADGSIILNPMTNSIASNAVCATVGGGINNRILYDGDDAVIGGGIANTINTGSLRSVIGGGYNNFVHFYTYDGFIGGGQGNDLGGSWGVIGGGYLNSIIPGGVYQTIGGGAQNVIVSGEANSIGGGSDNVISNGYESTISGGLANSIAGTYNFIGGGWGNVISNGTEACVIPGGRGNQIRDGVFSSFAAGWRARIAHDGCFVWADADGNPFGSSGINQFLIRAGGGVGIGVTNPAYALDVGNRIRLRQNGVNTAGLWLYDSTLSDDRAFIGMVNGGYVGFYGAAGASWDFVMNVTNGNVGIGTQTPGYRLEVNGLAHRVDNSASWTTTSDRRIKTDIEPIVDPLALIERIRPVNFVYAADHRAANPGLPDTRQYGIIAQDYQQVFPDFVHTNAEGYLTVDTSPLTFVNAAAIQALATGDGEQDEKIKALEKQNAEQSKLLLELRARLDALEKK